MSSFLVIIKKKKTPGRVYSDTFKGYSKAVINNIEIYYKGNNETLLLSFSGEKKFIISGLGIENSTEPKFLLKRIGKIYYTKTTKKQLTN
ncbi:MAG: hypothetical protein U5K00_09670 [Melioribacteraceae bacterium]|nr:hypothetical protein [Melioribacteraceae bacterium]